MYNKTKKKLKVQMQALTNFMHIAPAAIKCFLFVTFFFIEIEKYFVR